jgi:hypothetical protein
MRPKEGRCLQLMKGDVVTIAVCRPIQVERVQAVVGWEPLPPWTIQTHLHGNAIVKKKPWDM